MMHINNLILKKLAKQLSNHYGVILAMAVFLFLETTAIAMPARKVTRQYECDGKLISAIQAGDEYSHYYIGEDGKFYSDSEIGLREITRTELRAYAERGETLRHKRARLLGDESFPTTGSPRVLVILVEFSDRSLSFDRATFEDMMNKPGYDTQGASGSAADYFIENSCGQFSPQFDVYGPVKLSQPMSYYGGNNVYGNDNAPQEMVTEACRALDGEIDFRLYDTDGDRMVDNVYIFYAGYGENDGGGTSSVWPHSSSLASHHAALTLDGVSINKYSCSNELQNGYGSTLTGIGTFCHEFTHVLGFPDLYATISIDGENWTPDCWTIMDQGSYNRDGKCPPYYSSYERMSMGWLEPMEFGTTSSMLPQLADNIAYIVKAPDNENEFFLLEYREGGWDSALPADGVLIWHIDYDASIWEANTVNNTPAHNRVRLICADGLYQDNERPGVAWPGPSNNRQLTEWPVFSKTQPDAHFYIWSGGSGYRFLQLNGSKSSEEIPAPSNIKLSSARDKEMTFTCDSKKNDVLATMMKADPSGRLRFVDGAVNLRFKAGEEIKIGGLIPETEYKLQLIAIDAANGMSRMIINTPAMTAAPGISFRRPEAPVATTDENGAVTLSWVPVEGASSYLVNIYKEMQGGVSGDVVDFTDGIDNLPAGWTTTVTGTFSASGYFGNAKPSAAFESAGQYITSPVYAETPETFSFWMRGRSVGDDSSLCVYGSADGESYHEIGKVSPVPTVAATYEQDAAKLQGVKAIRIEVNPGGSSARVMLDDITIGFGHEVIRDFAVENLNVGDVTSYVPSGLETGTEYRAWITASDGYEESQPSPDVSFIAGTVSMRETSIHQLSVGVCGNVVTAFEAVRVYSVAGMQVGALNAGEKMELTPGVYVVATAAGKYMKIRI